MRPRIFILAVLCGAMVWGGYQASVLRASTLPPAGEVLAAAGGQPGFFAGAEGNSNSDDYRISALSVFSNVALHVKDNYVDPARIEPKEMLIGALDEIERQIAEVLVEDLGSGKVRVSVPGHSKVVTVGDVESLWEINLKLRDVFRFFEKHLPPQKDMRSVEYAAINGALSTLDPHSILLKPEAFAEMKTSTKGEFGGLGIVISIRDGKLTIISPLDGTPASRAGLRAMDVISRIGDVSTVSMPIEEAVRMLRGPEGSKVTIWVARKGWPEPRKHTLTRQLIKIESVESHLLEKKVGYVKIKNFQQNTGRDLDEHIAKLEKKAGGTLKGLVVDLRNNPGGLLEQAIKVSDKFLTSGDIVTTVGYGNKLRDPKRAEWSRSDLDVPLVVLVNNGSASASEIVAGALKNLDRAVILGQRTFGKGSVQVLYDFADSSALKLTIAQYLTPGNISIQNVGVTPDIELEPAWIDEKLVRLFYRPETHREKNLSKHLERANKSKAPAQTKPEYALPYLIEKKQKADESKEAPPVPEFEQDFPIRLAKDLLASVGKNNRSEMLAGAKAFLDKRAGDEQNKIERAIETLKVDWAAGSDTDHIENAAIRASLEIKGTAEAGTIAAGNEVTVEATVTNDTDRTLHRVHGHIETDHPAFKGREFLFGTLVPGATKSWTITTKIPKEAASRSDILELRLASNGKAYAHHTSDPVTTKYVPHPQFAYSFTLDDSERGDGDGVLERGEGVDFVVHVSNVGPGDADDVSLRLKSGAGEDLFLERGRIQIGAVAAGETKTGRLRFRVPEKASSRKSLPLELTIYDPSTGEWLEDELAVVSAPNQAHKVVSTAGSGVTTAEVQVLSAAAADVPVIATIPKDDKLRWTAKVGPYLRIELSKDSFAWVHEAGVKTKNVKKTAKTLANIAYHPTRRPPSIMLDGKLGGRVVSTRDVTLSGNVSGRGLRDMYVVLNDKKVFYAVGPMRRTEQPGAAWTKPNDEAVKLPFSHTLTLEDGLNKVLVVARLDEKVITYRSLFVSRVDSAPKVAEAGPEKDDRRPTAN